MRSNASFALDDEEEIKRLVRLNPWVTLVSHTSAGLVASHYPVVLDDTDENLAILSHVGRPDELLHELGQHEVLVVVQGPHGYISPGWYDADPAVPTWNFVVAHLHGIPEILSPEENLAVLGRLVDHFEDRMPVPRRMAGTLENAEYAARISAGTVGFRLRPTRIQAKSKLSQNRPAETVERIIHELTEGENYRQPELAAEMRRVHPVLVTATTTATTPAAATLPATATATATATTANATTPAAATMPATATGAPPPSGPVDA